MTESLFTTQTPSITDATDGIGYTLATRIRPGVAGTVSGIRWHFPSVTPSAGVTAGLYRRTDDTTGTLLASVAFGTYTLSAWNTATFSTPVDVTANDDLYAAIYTPDRYVATGGFFTGTTITNGNLTGPADDTVTPARNGRFASGVSALTYPNGQFNGGCYFADVVFTATSSTTTVGQTTDARWPVRALAGTTTDARWPVRALAAATRDLRWAVRAAIGRTRDIRWPVRAVTGATKNALWAVRALAAATRDARWQVQARIGATADARWQARTLAGSTSDVRWQTMAAIGTSGRTLALQWQTRAPTGRTADVRWQVHVDAGQSVAFQWDERAHAANPLRLQWAVESLATRYPDANGWTAVRASPRTVSTLSRDWVRLTLTAPTAVNPTPAAAALAIIPIGTEPAPGDWHTATWDPDGHPIYTDQWPLQVLTGPGTLLSLPAGTYGVWFRVDTTILGGPPPETVTVEAGTLTIT